MLMHSLILIVMIHVLMATIVVRHIDVKQHINSYYYSCYDSYDDAYYCYCAYNCYDAY